MTHCNNCRDKLHEKHGQEGTLPSCSFRERLTTSWITCLKHLTKTCQVQKHIQIYPVPSPDGLVLAQLLHAGEWTPSCKPPMLARSQGNHPRFYAALRQSFDTSGSRPTWFIVVRHKLRIWAKLFFPYPLGKEPTVQQRWTPNHCVRDYDPGW